MQAPRNGRRRAAAGDWTFQTLQFAPIGAAEAGSVPVVIGEPVTQQPDKDDDDDDDDRGVFGACWACLKSCCGCTACACVVCLLLSVLVLAVPLSVWGAAEREHQLPLNEQRAAYALATPNVPPRPSPPPLPPTHPLPPSPDPTSPPV